jgi:hypothetical protein
LPARILDPDSIRGGRAVDETAGGITGGSHDDFEADGQVRPLAVGLVRHDEPDCEPRRRQACLGLAARAHREGYTLLQTFELDGSTLRDDMALAGLADLTARREVSVVLAAGLLSEALLRELRDRRHLRVLALPNG